MDTWRLLLFGVLCVISLVTVHGWSGNVCYRTICIYRTRLVCAYRTWRGCCAYKTIREPAYQQQPYCCRGWRHSGDRNCNEPICNPPCQNGGTCTRPNVCSCPVQNPGPRCGGVTCSHLTPCFPGMCLQNAGCDCSSGFTSSDPLAKQNYCLKIENNIADVQIYQIQVRMANYKRAVSPPMMMFDILLDSSNSSTEDTFWTNRKDFNRLEANCSSQYFVPDVPPEPDYIQDFGFGIVEAKMQVWLQKLPPAGSTVRPPPSLNDSIPCETTVSNTQPEETLYQCDVVNENFDRLLEHGDILKVTYRTAGGGFRDVLDRNTGSTHRIQNYDSVTRNLSVVFQFDFHPPTHCGETSSCTGDETMLRVPDVTRTPVITITWKGWTDADSKMYRYSMEVFQMTKAAEGELEIHPDRDLDPLINNPVLHDGNRVYAEQYKLPSPGMYSIILEVADRANNTKYVRRLCLYDPNPDIALDPENALIVSSANSDSNYTYQSDIRAPIVVTWHKHFKKPFHVDNNLLGSVRRYGPELENNVKQIPQETELEDHEGDRTIDAIPNIDGIVRFEVGHAIDSQGGFVQNDTTPKSGWSDKGLRTNFTVPETPSAADTVTIWVKAVDVLGNEKIERTKVSFDSSPPQASGLKFRMNVPVPGIEYSSMFDLSAFDDQSGIAFVKWTFTRRNGAVLYEERVESRRAEKSVCEPDPDCRCTPAGDCFYESQPFGVSNCHMVVEKESLDTEIITVFADVTNMAGLVHRLNMTKGSLTELNGTEAYYPPQNITPIAITESSVTLTWEFPLSCFKRTALWVIVDGEMRPVHVDAQRFDVTGLDCDTTYTIFMVTDFERNYKSDKAAFTFTTASGCGLSGGAIAGIVIGLLILLALIVLIVVFVLYRRRVILQQPGPVNKQLNRMSHAFDNARRFTMKRSDPERAFSNNAYKSDEDEVYLYGHMAFNTHQNWQLADSDLTLLDHVAEGKFANIYKATWRHDGRSDTVAAKMLKPGFSEDDALKMMAKVNFFATAFDDHDNVIRFLGAVTDNTSWGPVLVMEYCECGQMDKWLASRRNNVDEQTMENMFRFSMGVAKGMEYLASKGITHRRLAARNILLTFVLDAKVAGFGPQHKEGAEDKMTRVPAKWAAPEVLEDKPPTEKSDVWSFGVVLWEIFSMGQVPYPNVHANQIGSRLKGGYRMDKPEFADDIHYDLMKECWQYKQSKRPTFKTVRARLEQHFTPGNRQSVDFYYDTHQLH